MSRPFQVQGLGAQLVLESMAEAVVVVDEAGRFVFFNAVAERLLGIGAVGLPPDEWARAYGLYRADGTTLVDRDELPLVRALRGESTGEQEILVRNARNPDGLFIGVTGTPIRNEDGRIVGGVAVFRDISERVRMRAELARTLELAALIKHVAVAANEAGGAEPAFQTALEGVCDLTAWPVGIAWRRVDAGGDLVYAGAFGGDRSRYASLIALAEAGRVPAEQFSVGRALALSEDAADDRTRIAARLGLRAAISFPILSADRMTGVLEFFSEHPIEADQAFDVAMHQVGIQLGRVLEREWARERERFFEEIFDHVAHPIFVKDRSFRWVHLNQAFCSMLGYERDEMLGKSDYDFFPREEADFFREKDREMFGTQATVVIEEEPITDAFGRRHLLSTTKVPLFGRTGEITHLVGIIHDITALKQAEERARRLAVEQTARAAAERAHQRAALLAESGRVLASSLVPETTLSRVSRLAVPGLGDWCVITVPEEGSGRLRIAAVGHGDRRREEQVKACLEEKLARGEGFASAAHVLRTGTAELQADTDSFLLESGCVPVHSAMCVPLQVRGRTLGTMTFAYSTSRRSFNADDLSLAEELAQRTAMALDNAEAYQRAETAIRVRDEFLQVASHELRTPLTSLKAQLQRIVAIAYAGGASMESFAKGLSTIDRQVDRLNGLIGSLLNVLSISTHPLELSRERVDLERLVRDVAQQLSGELERAGSSLAISVSGPTDGTWDGLRLRQVVKNLLANAIRFGAGKPIRLTIAGDAKAVRLEVTDRGIGIAPEDVQRIFDRFERAVSTRHFGGLGLGLFLTREFVEAHGGSIRVESRPEEGSTFTVTLPR